MRKSVWLLSAGLTAITTPAFAQDTSQAPAATDPSPTEQAAVDPNAQAAADEQPGEINITAQGRKQVLQDVPIAVTAIGGGELQNSGVTDIRQLNQLAPSLLVSSTGTEANGSARIRGIGTVGDNPGLESSVGVVIDGVYRPRNGVGFGDLGEMQRVEILKGPQGTLFGKNTSAGVINILTAQPTDTLQAQSEATVGNYGAFCWVAREVYGEGMDWIEFRSWMLRNASADFLTFYHQHGPEIADRISGDEKTKGFIRHLMDELKKR